MRTLLRRLSTSLGFERDWPLILVAGAIGLVMGEVAVLFITPLHWAEARAAELPRSAALWLVPTAPVAGALLAGITMQLIPRPTGGVGVTSVMYAIHRRQSRLPLRLGARKWIASSLTIGSGGSAGAEGPIVTIGAIIGSNVARLLRASPQSTATLLGCGAAAGLSAVFNAPIAGIFFVMEILLRDFSLRTFTPIVIAAVVAQATAGVVLGTEPIFGVSPGLAAALRENPFSLAQIPNYLVLGLVCGVTAALFIRGLLVSERLFGRLRVHPAVRPAVGAALLGAIGLAFVLLADRPDPAPEFYGNGYPVIRQLLDPAWYVDAAGAPRPAPTLLVFVVALGVLKAIATCLTIGSGGAGGLFAPSLLLGATAGGALGYVVNAIGWFPAASPATYAIVGMAAVVAATTHAPLTGILVVYEITRSYDIVLPLMLTAVISTIVGRLFHRESVYTAKLAAAGLRLGAMSDLTILRRLHVTDVPLDPAVTVRGDESAQRLLDLAEREAVSDLVVIDDDRRYVGVVTAADMRAALVYREAVPLLQVHELQRTDLPTVLPDEPLDVVLDKFSDHDVHSLAVLRGGADRTVLGMVSRSRLMREYQRALSEE